MNLESELLELPPAGNGQGTYHKMFGPLQRALKRGMDDDDVFRTVDQVLNGNPLATRKIPESDIINSIKSAKRAIENSNGVRHYSPPSPRFDTAEQRRLFSEVAQCGKDHRSYDDLIDIEMNIMLSSPIPIKNDFSDFLINMFGLDDFLYIGDKYGKEVKRVDAWLKDEFEGKAIGEQVCINPLTGDQHETMGGNPSYRCDSAVKRFRYYAVEFDGVDLEEQLYFWIGYGQEIRAIVYSGSGSYHVWFEAPYCATKEDWDRNVKRGIFGKRLAQVGVDMSVSNPSRLMRLPGVVRKDTGNRQYLLWLSSYPAKIMGKTGND